MRNSLFWRILFIGLIPLIILFIFFSQIDKAASLQVILQNNSFLFPVIVIVVIVLSYLVAKLYIQPIINLTRNLDESSALMNLFYKTKLLPVELRRLYKNILDFRDELKEERDNSLAEKAVFSSILRNMNDGILVVDQKGNVTLINQTACKIFDVTQEEALGQSLVEVIRHYKINELFEKTSAEHSPQVTSFETAPDKTYIRCIATPLDQETHGNILFLMQDLTRIRQLEIVRRDFVSNVSHELRTPLTSLKLITETLQDDLVQNPEEAKQFLNHMSAEVDNLTQIVEELLELSRIESGKVPLEKRWVQPGELITSACDRMILQAERAGLKCSRHISENLPEIYVDRSRLERVLVNLLHNAIKFTPPGGQIELSVWQKDNEVIFSVKDSGIGISPKDLSRIFERFYKSDRSRSERGTGLGLSISKHLVEAHGGKIWAESRVDQGSTFFFSIPLI